VASVVWVLVVVVAAACGALGASAAGRGSRRRLTARVTTLEAAEAAARDELAIARAEVARVEAAARELADRAEVAEQVGESRLVAFLDNSTALISLKDPFGKYQFVNRAFAALVGADGDQVVGTDDFDHWPQAAPDLRGHDQQVLVARKAVQFEEVLPLPDGPHTFLTVRFPLLDDDGVPTAIGAVATDITELTQVLELVAARERVLSTVIAASPDVITILEEDGTIRTTSVAFERIFGLPTRSLVNQCLFAVIHRDDVASTRESFERLRSDPDRRVTLRFRARRADGRWITIESHAQLMVGEQGEHDGVVMVSHDVSDQIALEAALRTAKEHAERASNAKSEFLSRVSHELRTPLNAMLGFAQLLELEGLADPAAEFVDQILKAGDHLLSLINEVLDIARIETGHLELRPEPLDADDALREVLRLTEPLASRAGVRLRGPEPSPDGAPLLVQADRQRLLQVLLNLVSNAIKYNHDEGAVDLGVEAGADGRVRLCVTDTGPGLTSAQIDRLFVPFDRLGLEHTSIEGTGVGLALSRGLAERMSGTLGVRSTPGHGSTFWIELPAAGSASQAAA
jgi:PAS domain S-box-containing protein